MTPLAHRIAKELTLPKKRRSFKDEAGLLAKMGDVHCFEVSDVHPLAVQLAGDVSRILDGPCTGFLPAPKTWVEHHSHGERKGWLLEQGDVTSDIVRVTHVLDSEPQGFFGTWTGEERLSLSGVRTGDGIMESGFSEDAFSPPNLIPAFLLLINSPKVIGRRQHMPHRGLQKAILAKRAVVGSFPLHAWTEIKLEVSSPKDVAGDGEHEAHLTGQKALHFCRAHLRIRLGRLEVVRAHWRGDASLGIKQSRYKITAARNSLARRGAE